MVFGEPPSFSRAVWSAATRPLIDVHAHDLPEMPCWVADGVPGEYAGFIPQPVLLEVLGSDLLDAPDPLLTDIRDPVKSELQFPPAILLRLLRHSLRHCFRRFPDTLSGEKEPVPPNIIRPPS
jgi:hypothetical protein